MQSHRLLTGIYMDYVALSVQASGGNTILSLFWMVLTIKFCMIYTDCGITARRPDLVMVDKITRCTQVLWNTKVEIFPLVFGALGALPGKSVRNLELLQLFEVNAHQFQKTALLKTDLILRKQLLLSSSS